MVDSGGSSAGVGGFGETRWSLVRACGGEDVEVARRALGDAVFEAYAKLLGGGADGVESTPGGTRVVLVERAEVPASPISPNFKKLFLMAIVMGVLGALPFAVMLMYGAHGLLRWNGAKKVV